jgi:Raf kinase inhibitor-like YbhB/YbcL family protein
VVNSLAFKPYFPIPRMYTQDGSNVSPPLDWNGVPSDAKELMLICEDPDAPRREPVVHWIMYRIPPQMQELPEGIGQVAEPAMLTGARQSHNYEGTLGYIGPKPPVGHGVHHYHFQLFAMDQPLMTSSIVPDKEELAKAMSGHILAQGELVGTYERTAEIV